jgi:uncharacterized protein with GYD domain
MELSGGILASREHSHAETELDMPQYLYQAAYEPESLAAQMKNPEDRLAKVGALIKSSVGASFVAGGFCYGEYDVSVIMEAPDEETAAGVAIAIAAGGAIKASKTTPLLSGNQWVNALKKASSVSYQPAR